MKKWEKEFDKYIKDYDMSIKQIKFKYFHSYEVEKLMGKLSTILNLNDNDKEVAEVIGLLHDIGRFPQIQKYGNCSDSKTGVDHAELGCDYLFKDAHIKDFYDNEENYNIIKIAIENHNKYKINKIKDDKELLFAKMIRDIDKIDIFRVIYEEYEVFFDKKDLSEEVKKEFEKEHTIRIDLKKTKTDSLYSNLAFIFDINFKESFQILKKCNYLNNLLDKVNVSEDSVEEFNKLRDYVNKYIDRKMEEL